MSLSCLENNSSMHQRPGNNNQGNPIYACANVPFNEALRVAASWLMCLTPYTTHLCLISHPSPLPCLYNFKDKESF